MADTLRVAGLRLVVEGASVFQETLTNNNQVIKISQTEIDKLTEVYKKNNNSAEYLAKKQQELNKQLDAQSKKVQALTNIRDTYAKQDNASQSTINKLNLEIGREELAQLKLQNQLQDTTVEIAAQEAAAQAAVQAQEDARIAAEAEAKAQEEAQKATEQHTDAIVDQRGRLAHLGSGLRQAAQEAGLFGEKAIKAGEKISRVGGKWSSNVTLPIAGGLTAAFAAFNTLDDGMDTVIRKTGATGQTLDMLEGAYNRLFTGIKTSAGDAGIAVGEVTTRFKATGQMLDDLAKDFIMFADVNETDLNGSIGKTSRILSQWGQGASSVKGFLGLVTNASQATGIAVDSLMASIQENGATMKAMGFNLDQTVQFLARVEAAGINTEVAMTALKKSAGSYAKDGKSLEEGLAGTVAAIQAAKTETEALVIAQKVFGVKGALEMATAIREGRFSITGFSADMSQMTGVVSAAFKEINGDTPELDKLKNKAIAVGAAFSKNMLPWINEGADALAGLLTNFGNLDPEAQKTILTFAGITAATGPAIKGVGLLTQGVGFLSKGFSFLAGPYGWIALAAGGLLALGVAIANTKTQAQLMDEQLNGINISVDPASKAAITTAINTGMEAAQKQHDITIAVNADITELQTKLSTMFSDDKFTKAEYKAASTYVSTMINPDIEAATKSLNDKVTVLKTALNGAVDAQGQPLSEAEKTKLIDEVSSKTNQLITDLQTAQDGYNDLLTQIYKDKRTPTEEEIAKLNEYLAQIGLIQTELRSANDEAIKLAKVNYDLTVAGSGNADTAAAAVGYVQGQQKAAISDAATTRDNAIKVAQGLEDQKVVLMLTEQAWKNYYSAVGQADTTAQAGYQAILDGVASMSGAQTTLATINQDYDTLTKAMETVNGLWFSRLGADGKWENQDWQTPLKDLFGDGGLGKYLSEDDKIKVSDLLATENAGIIEYSTLKDIANKYIGQLTAAMTENTKDPALNPLNAVLNGMLDSGALASIDPTKVDGAMESMFKLYDAKARGSDIGGDIVAGVPVGIGQAAENLPAESFDELKDAVLRNLQTAFDSHSPARVVIPIGENVPAGVAVGIKNNANAVQGAAALLPVMASAGLASLPGVGASAGSGMMAQLLHSLKSGKPALLSEASSIAAEVRRMLASAYAYRPSNQSLNVDMSLLTEEGFWRDYENATSSNTSRASISSLEGAVTIGPALVIQHQTINKEADAHALVAAADSQRKRQLAGVGAIKRRF